MKSLHKLAVASAVLACLATGQAMAFEPVPHKLNVQGVLRNVAGEVVTGTYNVTFNIYQTAAAGAPVYTELQTLTVTGGVFSAYIGPVAPTVFVDQGEAWLGIKINADAELPRKPISAVGFAIQAEHAEKADELIGAATDLNCTTSPCVGANEVTFAWAAGVSAGGPAADVQCVGCVNSAEIANLTIVTEDLADGAVATSKIAAGAVDNSKLAANSVASGNIIDGQVTTPDIADGAVTGPKIAANSISNTQLNVLYALSDAKGGEALSLKCDNQGCVNPTEVSFNYAAGDTKGGNATGLACTTGCVDSAEVTFNYAGSASKGGPASGLACTDCVTAGMAQFPYAASASEAGAALDLACQGGTACVDSTEVNFNYAGSTSKGGPASDVLCVGCVEAASLGFNWAAGISPGGDASGLTCTGCVGASDLATGSVVDAKIPAVAGSISGYKIQKATTTNLGVVQIGTGLTVDGAGILTPTWGTAAGTVASGNHVHADYFSNNSDIVLGYDKKFIVKDMTDSETAFYSYFRQASVPGDNQTGVKLVLGYQNTDATYFQVTTESGVWSGKSFEVTGAGNAYIRGNLTFGAGPGPNYTPSTTPEIICDGCAKLEPTTLSHNRVIANESVTGIDIKNGTVGAADLDPNMTLSTGGSITSGTAMYAPIYYDSNNTGFYADPNSVSRMSTIRFDSLQYAANTAFGFTGTTVYATNLVQGAAGTTLGLVNANCGSLEIFGGSCGGNTAYVRGNLWANILYDNQDAAWYADPNSVTRLRYLNTGNDNWLPHPNGWNYLRGNSYITGSGALYDENDGNYYIDVNGTSRMGLLYTNGLRLYNSWPGDPYGFAQFANSGGHLYMGPDANASQMMIFRQGGADRMYFLLAGASNIAVPSMRTDGGYLVINPGTSNRNIYMLWDTGGHLNVNGYTWSNLFVDRDNSSYCIDPAGASQIYNLWAPYIRGNYGFVDNFRTNWLGVWGNGGQSTASSQGGITLNNWAGVYPAAQRMGMVGHASRSFWGMHSYNYFGASNREKKRDIEYFDRDQLSAMGEKLYNLKPASWFYKGENAVQDEETPDAMVRQTRHVGLILDEMPAELTADGQAWSLNDSIGFLLIAGKYLEDENRQQKTRIRDLEDRIALMEQAMVDAGLLK